MSRIPTFIAWSPASRGSGLARPNRGAGGLSLRHSLLRRSADLGAAAGLVVSGWPYSFVAALESGRTSWTAVLDAVRLGPDDDPTLATAAQVREVVERTSAVRQWQSGDADILIVFDAGYDVTRLAFLLAGLPVELLGRLATCTASISNTPCARLLCREGELTPRWVRGG